MDAGKRAAESTPAGTSARCVLPRPPPRRRPPFSFHTRYNTFLRCPPRGTMAGLLQHRRQHRRIRSRSLPAGPTVPPVIERDLLAAAANELIQSTPRTRALLGKAGNSCRIPPQAKLARNAQARGSTRQSRKTQAGKNRPQPTTRENPFHASKRGCGAHPRAYRA